MKENVLQSSTVKRALNLIRPVPGSHFHGLIPCMPWKSWQRLNLAKGTLALGARLAKAREQSLALVKTLNKLGKAAWGGAGSVVGVAKALRRLKARGCLRHDPEAASLPAGC